MRECYVINGVAGWLASPVENQGGWVPDYRLLKACFVEVSLEKVIRESFPAIFRSNEVISR